MSDPSCGFQFCDDPPAQPELVVLRGLPGCGKSTRAREDFPGYLHYEPDHYVTDVAGQYRFDLQVWPLAQEMTFAMADHALARGEPVVVADVFPRRADVERYRKLAEAHGARFRVETLPGGGVPGQHRVPVTVIDRMRAEFEP